MRSPDRRPEREAPASWVVDADVLDFRLGAVGLSGLVGEPYVAEVLVRPRGAGPVDVFEHVAHM